jgi:hypothetical protein
VAKITFRMVLASSSASAMAARTCASSSGSSGEPMSVAIMRKPQMGGCDGLEELQTFSHRARRSRLLTCDSDSFTCLALVLIGQRILLHATALPGEHFGQRFQLAKPNGKINFFLTPPPPPPPPTHTHARTHTKHYLYHHRKNNNQHGTTQRPSAFEHVK